MPFDTKEEAAARNEGLLPEASVELDKPLSWHPALLADTKTQVVSLKPLWRLVAAFPGRVAETDGPMPRFTSIGVCRHGGLRAGD